MIKGIDTSFLVQLDVIGHPGHLPARNLLHDLLEEGAPLALAPQVLAEYIHIVTDSRRFERPLDMGRALARARSWWSGREIVHVMPGDESTRLFIGWMSEHGLGRKRLLDTALAATYFSSGIKSIVTSNVRDYEIFGCFEVIRPR